MNWSSLQKFLVDLAPYYLPMIVVGLLEWNRRKAETRKVNSESVKTDAEASKTMVEAAQAVVGTSGVVITQLEDRLSDVLADQKKLENMLEEVNHRYMMAMEEISNLSMRINTLRDEVVKQTNTIADKDLQISNLRKCVAWSLKHLRQLWYLGNVRTFMKGIALPTPEEEDLWISRAESLTDVSISADETN